MKLSSLGRGQCAWKNRFVIALLLDFGIVRNA
jgi:hypothetical protein